MNPGDNSDTRELVILLHGVALNRQAMEPIARRLAAAGYRTVNLSYPSRKMPLEKLASDWLPVRFREAALESAPRVHFVAHSMGTLLVRHYMAHSRPANAGRAVFIGPPSRGSELADGGRPRWFFRWFVGLNLRALGVSNEAFWRRLPQTVDYPLGIIVGTRPGNPFGRNLPAPHDGTVTVESTRIAGSTDTIELPWAHTEMLFRRRTAELALHFLQHGRFDPSAADAEASGD